MFEEKENQLIRACCLNAPDFTKAEELLAQGANINAIDEVMEMSVLSQCLVSHHLVLFEECDRCEAERCEGCERAKGFDLLSIVNFFIDHGWDSMEDGAGCLGWLVHSPQTEQVLPVAKRILTCPLPDDPELYEADLECIGTEESYQRCCEHNHGLENIYFTLYELVKAKKEHSGLENIDGYQSATGMRVERVVYFSDPCDLTSTPRGTEYHADIALVGENGVLLVTNCVNIYMKNDALSQAPFRDISHLMQEGLVGARLTGVSFDHREERQGTTHYGQPLVALHFDSGRTLTFTHNFGELPDRKLVPRFYTT